MRYAKYLELRNDLDQTMQIISATPASDNKRLRVFALRLKTEAQQLASEALRSEVKECLHQFEVSKRYHVIEGDPPTVRVHCLLCNLRADRPAADFPQGSVNVAK